MVQQASTMYVDQEAFDQLKEEFLAFKREMEDKV